MQLNLLPTIQQAISNLLTVYEPEFLRFGYSLFLAFATIIICWQGMRMMFSHDGLGRSDVRLRQAAALRGVRLRDDHVLRGADSRFRRVVQQPDHGPGVLLPERAGGAFVRQHLPPLRRTGRPLHAAGRLVHPREPAVLDGAAARRRREGAVAGRHRLRADCERGVRAPRADLRAVLHRQAAGLAVLGMAEVLHPVLVHSGGGDRLPDGLRAVRVQVRDDAAADDHAGRVRHLCAAGSGGPRNVLRGHPARAVADQFDLLGTRW